MEPTEITAGRWHLRPWRVEDVPRVVEICQDPEIPRWTSVPTPYAESDAAWFVDHAAAGWQDGSAASFAVCEVLEGAVMGSVAVRRQEEPGTWDVGYLVAAEARGQGLMSEVLGTVTRWAFAELGAQRVLWKAVVGNAASLRVAEKAGFVRGPDEPGGLELRGERYDCWTAVLLPE